MKVIYLPLESYPERYTFQLQGWTLERFAERQINIISLAGEQLQSAKHIRTSVALDPSGRTFYGLTQTAHLVDYLDAKEATGQFITADDVVYMQDMYQPGFSAIPYILHQLPIHKRPKIYTHCLAQSIDPEDFTFPMRRWMRHYELMVDQWVEAIFIASECQRDMLRTALFEAPIVKVGLPFDMHEVRERVKARKPLTMRSKRVIFASRFDREKQPHFFMDFVERMIYLLPKYEFAVATGQPKLRSNDANALERLQNLKHMGRIKVYEGLHKDQYYELLADSRLHVNTAKQDFVSNTLNEASALGTPSLCPAYLSFPEALNNSRRQLYIPWSVDDMVDKAMSLLSTPPTTRLIQSSAVRHHETLDKVINHMEANRDGQ